MSTDTQRAKIESLPREYSCPVCHVLINPNEALQSMCGHLYCKPCLTYVASTTRACPYDGYLVTETDAKPLVESNKMLADTIGKTMVYCSYQNSGCKWVGSLADSLIHCSECSFGNSLVMCCWCGIHIAHRQWREHVQVCHSAYNQASVAMATTQASIAMATSLASAQGHGVYAAMLTQGQWYQQPYQQYYQNYVGDYMQQQPMQLQSFAPQNQVNYVQVRPTVQHVAQTHSQMQQPQPQVQSQSLAMLQPLDAFPSPQANTVQDSVAENTIGQCQSNQPHASWTGPSPQTNQTNQVEAPPNNMFEYHQDHFPEQVSHVRPPQSLPTTHTQMHQEGPSYNPDVALLSNLRRIELEQGLPQSLLTTQDQMHQEGPSYNPDVALLSNLRRIELEQGLQKHQQTVQEHQPIPTILGVQPNMDHFSATAPPALGHAAPSLQRIPKQVHWPPLGPDKVLHIYGNKDDEAVMEGLKSSLTSDSTSGGYNVNRAAEVSTIKFDHKLKRKLTEACAEAVYGSSIVGEGSGIKSGPLGNQVVEENFGNSWKDLGKSLLVERESINPSMNGTPLMNPTLLDQDGLPDLSNLGKHFLTLAEKSRARSAESLDRGFNERSSIRTQEHEPGFELRPALRSSQPSIDLGEGQFRRGPGSPISEYLGMPSHGYGLSGGRSALHMSEFKGLGNLQMGDKGIAADVTGPVDSNGLRLEDVGSQLKGDGDWATKPVESSDFHSQAKEHQQESMDMVSMIKHNEKKHKMAPSGSSQFGNQNKNEEGRFKGSG